MKAETTHGTVQQACPDTEGTRAGSSKYKFARAGRTKLLGMLLLITSASCTNGTQVNPPTSTQESIKPPSVAGAAIAVYLTSDSQQIGEGHRGGTVLLLSRSGAIVNQISTTGIDGGALAVQNGTLYFSDGNSEFALGQRLVTVRRSTNEHAQSGLVVAEGKSVSILNHGVNSANGKYVTNVAVTKGGQITARPIDGFITTIADCDSHVVGVRVNDDASGESFGLIELGPDPGSTGRVLGSNAVGRATSILGIASPCVNNTVYVLAQTETVGDTAVGGAQVVRWNTKTGKQVTIPLRDGIGSPFHSIVSVNTVRGTAGAASALVGDSLVWVTFGGNVMMTNVATGVTRGAWTIPLRDPESGTAKIKIVNNSVLVLDAPDAQQAATFTQYALTTGKERTQIVLPEMTAASNDSLWSPSDFAVVDQANFPE